MNKNNIGLGNLPANPLNEIMKFLDAEDIAKLSGASKPLNQIIKNNPFAQEKISNAKLIVEKIYDIVHEIALSEYEESFWRNGDGLYGVPDKIWSHSLGRALKTLGNDKDQTPMVTFLEQLMFLEVLSMDENLFSSDKPFEQVIKDYLTQSKIQSRREKLLEQNHIINKKGFNRVNVFHNFNKIYFDQLSKTKKWDKKTKDTITSKFIKFWLYQGSKIKDLEKNRNVEEYNWPTFSNACKKLKRSFFDSKRSFSIDFKGFIDRLTTQELNQYLFTNKYYFVDHFKNEIINNIKFIYEQVLSKNKNLPDFSGENVSNKFKKLLGYLGVNSELIDELTLDLSKEKITLSEKTKVIAPLEQDNNSEVGLIQQILSAIKKFFGFDDKKAAVTVTIEKSNNNNAHEFFSKPKAKNLENGEPLPSFDAFQNEGLVK